MKITSVHLLLGLTAILIFYPSAFALAQGPLTPPGAPAPTMKTLEQVEPRIAVQTLAGDAFTLHRIIQPGSYYLTANIFGVSGKSGIVVAAENVTIDLNGFSLIGTAGTLTGIFADFSRTNITVRNGTVRNWANNGIALNDDHQVRVERVTASNNGGGGIMVGDNALVEACTALDNVGDGIEVAARSVVRNCTASGNDGTAGIRTGAGCQVSGCTSSSNDNADGISVGFASLVIGCVADSNANNGIVQSAGTQVTIKDCSASNNTGAGISAGISSIVSGCTVVGNLTGIIATDNSTVIGCQARNNSGQGIVADGSIVNCSAVRNGSDGIRTFGGAATVVANCTASRNRENGIELGDRSLAIGNSCWGNGEGGEGAGILSSGFTVRIEGNNVSQNDRGIEVTTIGCLIIRNSASGNTTNYLIVANNRYGPIINIPPTGTAAVNGDSAADTTTTTHPWANFSY